MRSYTHDSGKYFSTDKKGYKAMTYDEFLEIANLPEVAIPYTVYKTVIEPAYNISILNKRDFVKSLDLEPLYTEEYQAAKGLIKAAKVGGRVYINSQPVHDYCLLKGYEPDIIKGSPVLWTKEGFYFPVLKSDADKFPFRISLEFMIGF